MELAKSSWCNCNYISFTKLPWPGDSDRTFRSSSQAATCPPVYHTRRRLHTVPLIAERQAWPGDSERTFRSSSQAATCPPVYHTRWRLHTVPLIAERQAGKLWIPIFIVFGLTRPAIETESTASVADALSTRPLGFSLKIIFFKEKAILTLFYSTAFPKVRFYLRQ